MQNNFSHFSFFETPPILQKLQILQSSDWKDKTFYSEKESYYGKSNVIPIIGNEWVKKDSEYLNKFYKFFENEIILLNNYLLSKFKCGTFNRLLITKVPATSVIKPHIDDASLEKDSIRFIIPIISYPDIFYVVGNEEKQIPANEIWEINSELEYCVRNYSHTDSIHLTVDWKKENL